MVARRWNDFVSGSPLRRLGQDTVVACGTFSLGKGLGFAKEVVVAAYYGLSASLDIYLVAAVLIALPLSILINAVQTALIHAVAGEHHPRSGSDRLAGAAVILTVACLLLFLPFWLLMLPRLFPLLASGFPAEKQHELLSALRWLTPYYFFSAANLLGYGVLQAKRRYWANGLVPIATPLATMLIVASFGASRCWCTLVAALDVSTVLETVMLSVLLYGELHLSWRFSGVPGLRAVIRHALALLPGTAMIAVSLAVDQAIAASLGNGTNAALGYGYKLPAALLSVSAAAVGVTVLPYFSIQIAQERYQYCLHSFVKLARWIFLVGILLVLPLALLSSHIVTLLYQRGAFDASAVARVAPVQLAYFVQIPFAVLAILGCKALSALGRNGLVSAYTTTALMLQAILAYAIGVHIGAQGIALAAVCGSLILATLSFAQARRLLLRLSK